ncbi:YfcE family phosphodiesterase [Tissierella sp. P1]|uniref:metallophosphoesterase family protein n=1 Tax=Tissierella sp. P1 TaxID=1280483 RepID=UPI000B9FFCC4|nr:metallophosphoesterase family protein [Tissierella sp. P1]OZV12101.1 YfcE family phosphodiesterase [Tissierella sp. P1]
MKIGIISDTHITKNIPSFIDFLDTYFKEVDIIVHSGDYISIEVIEALQKYKNFIGVWGNVDEPEVKNLIKEKEVVTIEGYRIGIFHGHGTISNTLDRAYEKFREDDVDIIIFGHSHQPLVKTKKGILMLNPGSLTNKRQERWYSYIILELNTESIDLQFKFFS